MARTRQERVGRVMDQARVRFQQAHRRALEMLEAQLRGEEPIRYGVHATATRADGNAPNGEPFHVKMRASTEKLARDGGIIPLSAWADGGLAAFRENPVIPFGHNYSRPPVATSVFEELDREAGALMEYWHFHEQTELSKETRQMYELAIMRAASVGFHIEEFRVGPWDIQFGDVSPEEAVALAAEFGVESAEDILWIAERAELTETSAVVVPSDKFALSEGRQSRQHHDHVESAILNASAKRINVAAVEAEWAALRTACDAGDRSACAAAGAPTPVRESIAASTTPDRAEPAGDTQPDEQNADADYCPDEMVRLAYEQDERAESYRAAHEVGATTNEIWACATELIRLFRDTRASDGSAGTLEELQVRRRAWGRAYAELLEELPEASFEKLAERVADAAPEAEDSELEAAIRDVAREVVAEALGVVGEDISLLGERLIAIEEMLSEGEVEVAEEVAPARLLIDDGSGSRLQVEVDPAEPAAEPEDDGMELVDVVIGGENRQVRAPKGWDAEKVLRAASDAAMKALTGAPR